MSKIIIERLLKMNIDRQTMIKNGFAAQKYDDILRGKSNYKLDDIIKISEKFQLSLDYLILGKEKSSSSKLSEEEQKYTECYVAFLDILGFKEFVNNNDIHTVKSMFDIEDNIKQNAPTKSKSNFFTAEMMSKVKFNFISDTIVLSIRKSEYASLSILLFMINIMISNLLICNQLLLRGSISVGNFYETNNTLFGPAMNKAAELEKKIATYPRIIISPEIVQDYINIADKNAIEYINKYVENDPIIEDSYLILNYIKYILKRYNKLNNPSIVENYLKKVIDNIEKTLHITTDKNIFSKNIYFAQYFNRELSAIKQLHSLNFKCDNITIPANRILNNNEQNLSSKFSEDKQRILEMYDQLTEHEQGIIIGEMREMLRQHAEHKNGETA